MKKILAALIVISFLLKLFVIDKYGLAGDEKYSALVSQFLVQEGTNQVNSIRNPNGNSFSSHDFWEKKTFRDFQESMARRENGSGASYFLLLHYWTNYFGLSDLSLRLPSLIFTFLLVFVIYRLSLTFFENHKVVAWLSVSLAAISPFLFNYGLIARNYAFTYFWFALSTLLLIKILRSKENKILWYVIYGLSLTLTIFGHHSAFIIYILHIIIFLIERNWKKIYRLLLAGIPSIVLFLLWISSEGGKYAFEFMKNSNLQYLELAKKGLLAWSTPLNITNGFLQTFSDIFIGLSAQFNYISDPVKMLLLFVLGGFLVIIQHSKVSIKLKWILTFFIIALPNIWYMNIMYHYSFAILGCWVFIEILLANYSDNKRNKDFWMILILSFFPILMLIFYAISDGTVTRLNARYAGFAFPFLIILSAKGLFLIYQQGEKVKTGLFVTFILTLTFIENYRIFADNSPRYFHYTPPHRLSNPYRSIANKVVENYSEGDTLIHSIEFLGPIPGNVELPKYSVQDAQYINLYFPKKGKNIIQKFAFEDERKDKVFLKKSTGEEILIFDFEGTKYRY